MNENYIIIACGAAYALIEYFMGKTKIIKPNSVIEAVLLFAKKILESVKQ